MTGVLAVLSFAVADSITPSEKRGEHWKADPGRVCVCFTFDTSRRAGVLSMRDCQSVEKKQTQKVGSEGRKTEEPVADGSLVLHLWKRAAREPRRTRTPYHAGEKTEDGKRNTG